MINLLKIHSYYIDRTGRISNEVSIRIDTVEGTAEEGSDYRGIHDVVKMEPYQQELPVDIEISRISSHFSRHDRKYVL